MFYVYILYSHRIKQAYIGQTNNLDKRLKEHFNGKNFSTKNKLPLSLVCVETYSTRSDAMKREKFFKSLSGSKIKYKIIKKFLADDSSKS